MFPACPHLWTNFLEEVFIGHEFKLLSYKVHGHFIHNSCLRHSQMTKKTKKVSFTTHLKTSSFIIYSQLTKGSASCCSSRWPLLLACDDSKTIQHKLLWRIIFRCHNIHRNGLTLSRMTLVKTVCILCPWPKHYINHANH